jgi:hypothetical protein
MDKATQRLEIGPGPSPSPYKEQGKIQGEKERTATVKKSLVLTLYLSTNSPTQILRARKSGAGVIDASSSISCDDTWTIIVGARDLIK